MVGVLRRCWYSLFGGPRPYDLPKPFPMSRSAGEIKIMVVDGKRWFYGLNSRGDHIITPLIDDRFVMVAFASRYMRPFYGDWASKYFLTAGEKALHWHDVIDRAIDKTEPNHIASEPFSPDDFRRIAVSLKQAAADDRPITGFTVRPDLLGLLALARGCERPSSTSANASLMAKDCRSTRTTCGMAIWSWICWQDASRSNRARPTPMPQRSCAAVLRTWSTGHLATGRRCLKN